MNWYIIEKWPRHEPGPKFRAFRNLHSRIVLACVDIKDTKCCVVNVFAKMCFYNTCKNFVSLQCAKLDVVNVSLDVCCSHFSTVFFA